MSAGTAPGGSDPEARPAEFPHIPESHQRHAGQGGVCPGGVESHEFAF